MRIVIDMQGAQSSGSWNRGIGRYTMSLALAIAQNHGKQHEIILALNGAFPESIERVRASFSSVLPWQNIRVWHVHEPVAHLAPENVWRRKTGELVREAFLASLRPDVVLVSSLFEGLVDDAVTSIERCSNTSVTAVILYDLIPYIHRRPYLENPTVEAWYLEKIEHLQRSDLFLTISESSRQEGIECLGLSSGRCVNISTDADSRFEAVAVHPEAERSLRERYSLPRKFVMYTGGIDYRKNIERLIGAYAKLSPELRRDHQLAIVCSVGEESRLGFSALAEREGLFKDEVILTGFVPDEDLIALYNLCAVFVFPSFHEGFGLPALEAMRSGAPVIASNVSSLPEVVGLEEALFDPYSEAAIARKIQQVLVDYDFRARLILHGKAQAKIFSWNESARRAIESMEKAFAELKASHLSRHRPENNRPKLAYVSPLPPERSGISDYSAELLPALAEHYDIEVIVAQSSVTDPWIERNCPIRSVRWFLNHSDSFDRVLYHFGNSAFHQHMFGLLKAIPGVVVLHDFYLSGALHHMDAVGYAPGCFSESLYASHGYLGLLDRSRASNIADVIWRYPCSREVLEDSIGTIFHSADSARLLDHWYGSNFFHFAVIPLMRGPAAWEQVGSARDALAIQADEFVVCSFGLLGPTKLNHRLLSAWLASDLAKSGTCRLVFVGENHAGDYGADLLSAINKHPYGSSVSITGWVDQTKFRGYLSSADIAVQLRTKSRGETSAAVLDCMNYGLATIVNANGSMADLDGDAVWKMPNEFDDQDLIEAMETLWRDRDLRISLGGRAKAEITDKHDPRRCASLYRDAIEDFYAKNRPVLKELLPAIAALPLGQEEALPLAQAMALTFPKPARAKQLLVDVSELVQCDAKASTSRLVMDTLREWLTNPPPGFRVEPVYATPDQSYCYARQFTARFLGITHPVSSDERIDFTAGDVFFAIDHLPQAQSARSVLHQRMRQQGVTVNLFNTGTLQNSGLGRPHFSGHI